MGVVDSVGGCRWILRRLDGHGIRRMGRGTATSWVIRIAIIVLRQTQTSNYDDAGVLRRMTRKDVVTFSGSTSLKSTRSAKPVS